MVFSASFRGVFFFNFPAAISKAVKKVTPRASGRGPRKRYIMEISLFSEAFSAADPWVGTGEIFVDVEFFPCFCLFMAIGQIPESVGFRRLYRLI